MIIIYSNIYVITNVKNNMKYVGQAVNIEKRWKEHIRNAKRDESTTIYLYNSMRSNGLDNFKFEILEELIPIEDINVREEFWIKNLNTLRPNGYNLTLGGEGTKGYTMSDETKSVISEKAKERYDSLTEEEKLEYVKHLKKSGDHEKMMDGYYNWFENLSEVEKKSYYNRISETKKNKGYDFYNFSFGKMTEEEKSDMYKKVSKSNPRSTPILMYKDGDCIEEFHSLGEAGRYLNENFGINKSSKNRISRVLDTESKAYGYTWKRKQKV